MNKIARTLVFTSLLAISGSLIGPISTLVAQSLISPANAPGGYDTTCGCECADCQNHGCAGNTCRTGRCRNRGRLLNRQQCPECQCDECFLVVAPAEVWNTCFKTEQKVVCIPRVRLPWQRDCPPTTSARSRVVTVLKAYTFKCPGCSYQWTDRIPEPAAANPPMITDAAAEVSIVAQIGQRLARVETGSETRPSLRSILFSDESLPSQLEFENSLPPDGARVPPITVIQR